VLVHVPKDVVAWDILATVASPRCMVGPAALLILDYHQLIKVSYATADE
jgi:hypothetical protein